MGIKARRACPGYKLRDVAMFGGAHMQILRRSSLEYIINYVNKHGPYIMDDVKIWLPNHAKKLVWKADIVQQFAAPFGKHVKNDLVPDYCGREVYKHTVTKGGFKVQESEM